MLKQDGKVTVSVDGTECVVLRADLYQRLQDEKKRDGSFRPREIDLDFPAGWNDDGSEVDVDDYVS